MKVTTKIVWDKDFNVIEWEGFDYFGSVDLLKGGASKTEQQAADQQRTQENQLTKQQLDLQMKQLGMQQNQLNSVNAAVDPTIQQILGGNTPGVLQPLQSALTASYMNQLPNTYRNAIGNINQNLVARGLSGGQNAGGGGIGQDFGYMTAMLGQEQQAGAINTAETMSQANLGLLQNDLGLKLGVANQFGGMAGQYGANVGGFNQGALGALGQGVQAARNVDEAQTSWMGPVFGAIGSLGGAAIGPGGWLGKPKPGGR